MHPLDGAYERVGRAHEHLLELKVLIANFERPPDAVIGIPYDETDTTILKILMETHQSDFGQVPTRISIIVGEVIYNLRSALDYLVYELACLDAKQVVKGTQFPIEDSKKTFSDRIGTINDKRRNVYLRGIKPCHIATLSKLQPCNGCDWTKRLRDISNPDKHMHLTVLETPFGIGGNIETKPSIPGSPVKMNYQVTFYVAFDDGIGVIDTLEQLHSSVSAVINFFKSEFA